MRVLRAKRKGGCIIAAAILAIVPAQAHATNVWIDTDPSIGLPFREVDDAFALVLAFHAPPIRITGISTTYGNASLKDTTRIARDLVARFSRERCDVFAGARSREDRAETDASKALATALAKEHFTYIALGPLTNLATFLRLHPELEQRIDRIFVVGGQTSSAPLRLGKNGRLRIHDANVFKDPAAVAEVLKSKCPITVAPIQTSIGLQIRPEDLHRIRRTSSGEFFYRRTHLWSWFWQRVVGLQGGPIFDALPMMSVTRPDLVATEQRYAVVDRTGLLVARRIPMPGGRPVRFSARLRTGAEQWLRERLPGDSSLEGR